jgi:hypothetical protein
MSGSSDLAGRSPMSGAAQLFTMMQGVILHHSLSAAGTLGIADVLKDAVRTAEEIAETLNVDADALCRLLRFLAGHGVFVQTGPRTFMNSEVSHCIRSDVGAMRALVQYRASPFFLAGLSDLLYSLRTAKPAREKVLGMGGFEYLRQHEAEARLFDDAMTAVSSLFAPAIASAYDFGQWGHLADVGGGNGILLAAILRAHPSLCGVLMELEHVLRRADEQGFLSGDLAGRARFVACDFLHEIPQGCRAYLMKSVIHDWDDAQAIAILRRCRRAVPSDGALLLVEHAVGDPNTPSPGKAADIVMLTGTGGRERSAEEYGALLEKSGFRLTRTIAAADELILESQPVEPHR